MRSTNSQPSLLSDQDALRTQFGNALVELGKNDSRLVVLDADVAGGTGAAKFQAMFPERFVQVGIAEQNLIGIAAGLAAEGWKPVVATFSAFLLRAIDQIRVSLAYAGRAVTIVSSHSGLDVGPDGASAQCLEDLAVFRSIPSMNVFVPSTGFQLGPILSVSTNASGPTYLRTGRSPIKTAVGQEFSSSTTATIHLDGTDVALVTCGPMVYRCIRAANELRLLGISARVIEIIRIKPLDKTLLEESIKECRLVVTVEDHSIIGGLGSAIIESGAINSHTRVLRLGTPDVFGHSAEPPSLYQHFGLEPKPIASAVAAEMKKLEKSFG